MKNDKLRRRFVKSLRRQRISPQEMAVELHDYDFQKKHFGKEK